MKNKEYANIELEKCVVIAKNNGLKVWTFETTSNKIQQVFFDNGKTFGTASAELGLIHFGTCHKRNRHCGTGFRVSSYDVASLENIQSTFQKAPRGFNNYNQYVIKESWAEHIADPINSILKYYEL